MLYHIIAFLIGYILDLIVGDPMNFPHPIRLIGTLIGKLDKALNKRRARMLDGVLLCIIVVLTTAFATTLVIVVSYKIHVALGIAVEAILTCYILAARSLQVESMKVYHKLKSGTLEEARYAVSMIVGRDTDVLDQEGVTKAAVETVAENTSDGVIAPMLYTALGGPILGFIYKAVNTMDSMVGYHNEKYEYFGKAAARLDDIFNYIPSRLSAVFMILASYICGKDYSGREAVRIYKRDRNVTKSPNAGQTESVCAGALGIRLAGNAYYFGRLVEKPYIGDEGRSIEAEDIKRSCKLMYVTELITVLVSVLFMGIVLYIVR
ncbi:MAG: adenosylcobinamide-phosphate synthase CbiB [Eubacterium sp.]|nr:adenosylcobinamide-phosphate synthase CbiB [Eubacterium sp.]